MRFPPRGLPRLPRFYDRHGQKPNFIRRPISKSKNIFFLVHENKSANIFSEEKDKTARAPGGGG
jgi:hypothetical protein